MERDVGRPLIWWDVIDKKAKRMADFVLFLPPGHDDADLNGDDSGIANKTVIMNVTVRQ